MITYRRDVPPESIDSLGEVVAHVRAHLSSVAAEDDDPETNADDVHVEVRPDPIHPGVLNVIGTLDANPVAYYLHPDYDPDNDHPEFRTAGAP